MSISADAQKKPNPNYVYKYAAGYGAQLQQHYAKYLQEKVKIANKTRALLQEKINIAKTKHDQDLLWRQHVAALPLLLEIHIDTVRMEMGDVLPNTIRATTDELIKLSSDRTATSSAVLEKIITILASTGKTHDSALKASYKKLTTMWKTLRDSTDIRSAKIKQDAEEGLAALEKNKELMKNHEAEYKAYVEQLRTAKKSAKKSEAKLTATAKKIERHITRLRTRIDKLTTTMDKQIAKFGADIDKFWYDANDANDAMPVRLLELVNIIDTFQAGPVDIFAEKTTELTEWTDEIQSWADNMQPHNVTEFNANNVKPVTDEVARLKKQASEQVAAAKVHKKKLVTEAAKLETARANLDRQFAGISEKLIEKMNELENSSIAYSTEGSQALRDITTTMTTIRTAAGTALANLQAQMVADAQAAGPAAAQVAAQNAAVAAAAARAQAAAATAAFQPPQPPQPM